MGFRRKYKTVKSKSQNTQPQFYCINSNSPMFQLSKETQQNTSLYQTLKSNCNRTKPRNIIALAARLFKTKYKVTIREREDILITELYAKTYFLTELHKISEPRLAKSIINSDAGSVTFLKKYSSTVTIKFQHFTSHTWKVQNK